MQTFSRKGKIAVVSRRQSVCDFFVLEGRVWGYDIETLTAIPDDIDRYDTVIIDGEVGGRKHYGSCRIIKIVETTDGESEDVWEWPVAVSDLRSIYSESLSVESADRNGDGSDANTLYLLDDKVKAVIYKGRKTQLTDGEWSVLRCLSKTPFKPVSREELMLLFGADKGNIADVYVCRLRKKLEDPTHERLIVTVRGSGYKLLCNVENT